MRRARAEHGVDWLSDSVQDPRVAARVQALLKRAGRVHVPDFLGADAARIVFDDLRQTDWRVLFRGERTTYETTIEDFNALDGARRTALMAALYADASSGFQYLYDVYRISDLYEANERRDGALADVFAALNSRSVLAALRKLTGDDRIAYVDARATRYRVGHFLTTHDDDDASKHRLYAYVLNLTPKWRPDWGGLLMFIAPDGHVAEAFTPSWNALNILKVPQPHAVSMVAPFASANRFSITGWLRSCGPDP